MKVTLAIEKVQVKGRPGARIIMRGNVGAEKRTKLDLLVMIPFIDISNCREKFFQIPEEIE